MRRLVTSRLIWIYTFCTGVCFSLPHWKAYATEHRIFKILETLFMDLEEKAILKIEKSYTCSDVNMS